MVCVVVTEVVSVVVTEDVCDEVTDVVPDDVTDVVAVVVAVIVCEDVTDDVADVVAVLVTLVVTEDVAVVVGVNVTVVVCDDVTLLVPVVVWDVVCDVVPDVVTCVRRSKQGLVANTTHAFSLSICVYVLCAIDLCMYQKNSRFRARFECRNALTEVVPVVVCDVVGVVCSQTPPMSPDKYHSMTSLR